MCWVLSSSWVRDRVTAQGPHQSGVYSDSHRTGQPTELIVGMDAKQNYNGGGWEEVRAGVSVCGCVCKH